MDSAKAPKKSMAPLIAAVVSLILGAVSIYQLFTLRIRVTNSDVTRRPYYIEYSERPMDFILIESLMILVALGAGIYAVKKFKAEARAENKQQD